MSEFMPGGRRRVDRVLAPDYLTGLSQLALEDIRTRRGEAEQEEVDLSYARRLLQGRIDILRAEQETRASGGTAVRLPRTDAEIVGALARILADGPRTTHGMGRYLGNVEPSRVGEHRREAERAVADVGSSDLAAMSDAVLTEAVVHLTDIESRISRTRRSVQIVVDALTEEIARRYATGEIEVVVG